MTDPILAEIHAFREEFAREHNYDPAAMAAEMRRLDELDNRKVVRLPPRPVVQFNVDPVPLVDLQDEPAPVDKTLA